MNPTTVSNLPPRILFKFAILARRVDMLEREGIYLAESTPQREEDLAMNHAKEAYILGVDSHRYTSEDAGTKRVDSGDLENDVPFRNVCVSSLPPDFLGAGLRLLGIHMERKERQQSNKSATLVLTFVYPGCRERGWDNGPRQRDAVKDLIGRTCEKVWVFKNPDGIWTVNCSLAPERMPRPDEVAALHMRPNGTFTDGRPPAPAP